jgi:LacI family transcriptional regulator
VCDGSCVFRVQDRITVSSLSTIARKLNVSISLVSKVLNNRLGNTGVRQELIDQIHRTAKELGYRKNHSALSLLSNRQNTIGLMLHRHGEIGSGLVETLLHGMEEQTRASQLRISIQFFRDADEFRAKRGVFHTGMIDGLIVGGVMHPEIVPDMLMMQEEGLHVVTVYNQVLSPKIPNIGVPDAELTELGTTHLIQKGCRRILHICTLPSREKGYRSALRAAGIPVRKELMIPASHYFNVDSGEEAVMRAMEQGMEFDAVSAESDAQAVGALRALLRSGKRVPEDVMIAGVDDAPISQHSVIPITSVSQRNFTRGALAVRTLEALIAGRTPEPYELHAELKPRASTGD